MSFGTNIYEIIAARQVYCIDERENSIRKFICEVTWTDCYMILHGICLLRLTSDELRILFPLPRPIQPKKERLYEIASTGKDFRAVTCQACTKLYTLQTRPGDKIVDTFTKCQTFCGLG